MKRIAIWVGVGMWVTGVVLGFLTVHDPDGDSCGSGFTYGRGGAEAGYDVTPQPDSCIQPRAQARQLPIALFGVGTALLLSQLSWGWAARPFVQPSKETASA